MKNNNKMKAIAAASLLCWSVMATAQTEGVSIKTTQAPPHESAMLDIESSSKGILIPRVSLDDVFTPDPVTNPAEGVMIYNATGDAPHGFYYWNGTFWQNLGNNQIDESRKRIGGPGVMAFPEDGSNPIPSYKLGYEGDNINLGNRTSTGFLSIRRKANGKVIIEGTFKKTILNIAKPQFIEDGNILFTLPSSNFYQPNATSVIGDIYTSTSDGIPISRIEKFTVYLTRDFNFEGSTLEGELHISGRTPLSVNELPLGTYWIHLEYEARE